MMTQRLMKVDHLILLTKHNTLLNELPEDITIHNEFSESKLSIITSLIKIYKKYNIDCSISHLERPNKLNLIASFFSKTEPIAVLHSVNMYKKNSLKERITKQIFRVFAKKIIAISPAVENYLVNDLNVPKSKVTLVENGIDFNRINRIRLKEKNKRKTFFCLGRLIPAKGFDFMIDALNDWKLLEYNWRLNLIGGGPLYDELQKKIKDNNLSKHVFLLGEKTTPFQHVNKGSIAIMPSRKEGLPIALLEIMSLGIPVLTSDIEQLNIVEENINGFKFKSEDADSLRTAFLKAIFVDDIQYEDMSKGAEKSVAPYAIEVCVNKYLKLI